MQRLIIVLSFLFVAIAPAAFAAHTQVELLLAADTAAPGSTVLAGVRLKMAPHWHTYWKNPGEAGQATEIKWTLPPGVSAGDIQWPLPNRIPPAAITTFGYDTEVVLLVPLKLTQTLKAGPIDIAAKVSWLECYESCVPADADVHAALEIGTSTKASTAEPQLASWHAKVPATSNHLAAEAWWAAPPPPKMCAP
jgi:DsbC/DsbD-like thiol-disulfide interchange protein